MKHLYATKAPSNVTAETKAPVSPPTKADRFLIYLNKGTSYALGKGCLENKAKAKRCYEMAMELMDRKPDRKIPVAGGFFLKEITEKGDLLPATHVEAEIIYKYATILEEESKEQFIGLSYEKFYKIAASVPGGHAEAEFAVGRLAANYNSKDSCNYLDKAALKEHPGALYMIAVNYLAGANGRIENEPMGVFYMRLAAAAKHTEALYQMGVWHENGKENLVHQSQKAAIENYQQAAALGNNLAKIALNKIAKSEMNSQFEDIHPSLANNEPNASLSSRLGSR